MEMPEIRVLRRIDNRRPSFTPEEYAKLIEASERRIYETVATTKLAPSGRSERAQPSGTFRVNPSGEA